jgi:uncharacterized membrane protein
MTIKAILRNGAIKPIEPLPAGWAEGQELLIEGTDVPTAEDLRAWAAEMEASAARLPAEEHEHFERALDEVERESKEAVRREWGLK